MSEGMFDRDPPHESPDADTTFDLLSNVRRQTLLRELHRAERLTLKEAARRIAAEERSVPVADVDGCKSVYVSLYQTHIPKLEENEVVQYDAEGQTISLVDSPTTRRILRVTADEPGRRWLPYYAAATLVGVCLLVVAALSGGTGTTWRLVAGGLGLVAVGTAAAEVGWNRYGDALAREGLAAQ